MSLVELRNVLPAVKTYKRDRSVVKLCVSSLAFLDLGQTLKTEVMLAVAEANHVCPTQPAVHASHWLVYFQMVTNARGTGQETPKVKGIEGPGEGLK